MPRVGFEPMIPVFERAKAVHALERAATVIEIFRTSTFTSWKNIQRCAIMATLSIPYPHTPCYRTSTSN
jgi:hypothetical protein